MRMKQGTGNALGHVEGKLETWKCVGGGELENPDARWGSKLGNALGECRKTSGFHTIHHWKIQFSPYYTRNPTFVHPGANRKLGVLTRSAWFHPRVPSTSTRTEAGGIAVMGTIGEMEQEDGKPRDGMVRCFVPPPKSQRGTGFTRACGKPRRPPESSRRCRPSCEPPRGTSPRTDCRGSKRLARAFHGKSGRTPSCRNARQTPNP